MSPKLLILLFTEAPPGEGGLSAFSEGGRLVFPWPLSPDLVEIMSLKSWEGSWSGAADERSAFGGSFTELRAVGAFSTFGVSAMVCRWTRPRWDVWDVWEAVEPWDWRRFSAGMRASLTREYW